PSCHSYKMGPVRLTAQGDCRAPLLLFGTCVELCSGDWDCGPEEHCVRNGCGHECVSD
uniref:WAP domain-containing protein n=1 Tax=Monodon monoceros TaxID=40151 RepID=A0A8C6CAB1_MONMO